MKDLILAFPSQTLPYLHIKLAKKDSCSAVQGLHFQLAIDARNLVRVSVSQKVFVVSEAFR
jgi:hypothetical protein